MRLETVRFGIEELKFIRSFHDIGILYNKIPFILPRLGGRMARNTMVPPSLQLEPTNHCNLKCISCPRETMGREKGFMDFRLFQKILDDAHNVGVKMVHLYLHGEPLLHPEIIDMIAYIKSKGLGLSLTTNGMLLDRRKSEQILASNVNSADYVTFSILGGSKETHESIMKHANHEKVVRNISGLLELRRARKVNGPIIQTIFYRMPENASDEINYHRKWRRIVDHVRSSGYISRSFADFNKGDANSIPLRDRTCPNIWERMTIYWNGDVTVCCGDVDGHAVLGSLREQSIREIWNSKELQSLKMLHREKRFEEISLCRRCDV